MGQKHTLGVSSGSGSVVDGDGVFRGRRNVGLRVLAAKFFDFLHVMKDDTLFLRPDRHHILLAVAWSIILVQVIHGDDDLEGRAFVLNQEESGNVLYSRLEEL